MHPKEFWECSYKEINKYCKMNIIRRVEDFKQEIVLQDASTDKLIQAHPLLDSPKVIPIRKNFDKLFKK